MPEKFKVFSGIGYARGALLLDGEGRLIADEHVHVDRRT